MLRNFAGKSAGLALSFAYLYRDSYRENLVRDNHDLRKDACTICISKEYAEIFAFHLYTLYRSQGIA